MMTFPDTLYTFLHVFLKKTLLFISVLYCSSQGYGEFIKPRWMNRILAWQEPKGCYSDDRQPFLRLTGFVGPTSATTQKEREVRSYVLIHNMNSNGFK